MAKRTRKSPKKAKPGAYCFWGAEGCTREQEMADVTHPFPHPPGRPVLVWCFGKEWPQSVRG